MTRVAPLIVLALLFAGCPKEAPPAATATGTATEVVATGETAAANPFAEPSPLPFELPPFDRITTETYLPAFEEGMKAHEAEIAAIVANEQPPTFDNTIVALERSGSELTRVERVFSAMEGAMSNDEIEAISTEIAPKLTAHYDAILLDDDLFARVDAVYSDKDDLDLDPESAQLLERYHSLFVHAGAKLDDDAKTRVKAINERLSTLETQVQQNILGAMQDGGVLVEDEAELAGMTEADIAAAAEDAAERGQEGKWWLALQNTTRQPVLAALENRDLRRRVFEASSRRATSGEYDNTALISEMMKLRAEKATLFGYPDWAAYTISEESAHTPEAVDAILRELAPAALAAAKAEAAEIQAVIDAEAKAAGTEPFELQPWDWEYYAEKVRQERYAFDSAEVEPYFELERVLNDGVFYSAEALYGVTFEPRDDLPAYHPDVRVYEVKDADGSSIGLFLLDPYAREGKAGGAWMETFVDQSDLLGQKPVAYNCLNVEKPPEGLPALMTFSEAETMFHEFGHATHGLFSKVKYPLLSGVRTPNDFVEYPSQINEMWAREPEVLAHYAVHYETGEPMPQALFDKVIAATKFNGGYDMLEYLEAAMIDQAWHTLTADEVPPADGVMDFEARVLDDYGVAYPPVPPRYHTPYFAHITSGGYSAGYYSYIWSEVLARDTGAWFHEHGGMTRENGMAFREGILSRGRTEEPVALFEALNGGPPDIAPLLAYRGLSGRQE